MLSLRDWLAARAIRWTRAAFVGRGIAASRNYLRVALLIFAVLSVISFVLWSIIYGFGDVSEYLVPSTPRIHKDKIVVDFPGTNKTIGRAAAVMIISPRIDLERPQHRRHKQVFIPSEELSNDRIAGHRTRVLAYSNYIDSSVPQIPDAEKLQWREQEFGYRSTTRVEVGPLSEQTLRAIENGSVGIIVLVESTDSVFTVFNFD